MRNFVFVFNFRYKITCPLTWPNYEKDMKDGCNLIIKEHHFESDVKFGNTKIFVKSPKTIFALEEERKKRLPIVVLKMQKVGSSSKARFFSLVLYQNIYDILRFKVFTLEILA